MFSSTKILTVCSVVSTMLLSSAVTAQSGQMTKFVQTKTIEIVLPSVPSFERDEMVLVCVSREALEDIVVHELYDTVEGSGGCGLVEFWRLTYTGAVQRAYTVFIEGDPVGVGFYPVQVYARSYALAWPSPFDPHLVDPEYMEDNGSRELLVRRGFPGDSCSPPLKPLVIKREVMVAEVAK